MKWNDKETERNKLLYRTGPGAPLDFSIILHQHTKKRHKVHRTARQQLPCLTLQSIHFSFEWSVQATFTFFMRVEREGMFQLLPHIRNLHVFRHAFKCYRNSLRKVSHNGMKVGTRIPLHSSHRQMCACIKQPCNKCRCIQMFCKKLFV